MEYIQHITTKAHICFVKLQDNATNISLKLGEPTHFRGSLYYMSTAHNDKNTPALYAKSLPDPIFGNWTLLGKLSEINNNTAETLICSRIEKEFSGSTMAELYSDNHEDDLLHMSESDMLKEMVLLNKLDLNDNWIILYCILPEFGITKEQTDLIHYYNLFNPPIYFDGDYITQQFGK